jgi:hypothetical protein
LSKYNKYPTFALKHNVIPKKESMLKKFIVLVIAFIPILAYSQEERIVIVEKGRSRKEPKDHKIVDNSYVIKFSPVQMLRGEINLGLEKTINEMSSVEIELGPTISEIGFSVNENHFNDPFGGPGAARITGTGFFGSVAYRFYPMDGMKVLNGFYISPIFKYRLYNFGLSDFSGVLAETKGREGQTMFTMNVGVQRWYSDHFSMDFFAGLGLCQEVHKTARAKYEYNGSTGEYDYSWDRYSYHGVRFTATMGVKIGIGR